MFIVHYLQFFNFADVVLFDPFMIDSCTSINFHFLKDQVKTDEY